MGEETGVITLPSKFICRRCRHLDGIHESVQSFFTITCSAARAVVEPMLRSMVGRYELCPHRGGSRALTTSELKVSALFARTNKPTPEETQSFEEMLKYSTLNHDQLEILTSFIASNPTTHEQVLDQVELLRQA